MELRILEVGVDMVAEVEAVIETVTLECGGGDLAKGLLNITTMGRQKHLLLKDVVSSNMILTQEILLGQYLGQYFTQMLMWCTLVVLGTLSVLYNVYTGYLLCLVSYHWSSHLLDDEPLVSSLVISLS